MESFLLTENSTSLIVILKISDLHNAYTDCVPSWTANYIRNSGDDYSTKRKNAVWSCGSSMNCKIRAMHFLPWSTRLVKKSLIGQRKDYIFIFIPLNLNLISLSKNVQPFNSYFPHLNPMPAFILVFHPWLALLLILLLKNMLLSSACSHNNNPISTTLCNMTRVATRVGEVASSVRLGSACREIFSYFCTSGCIPMASFITTSLTIKITTGVKKNKI